MDHQIQHIAIAKVADHVLTKADVVDAVKLKLHLKAIQSCAAGEVVIALTAVQKVITVAALQRVVAIFAIKSV